MAPDEEGEREGSEQGSGEPPFSDLRQCTFGRTSARICGTSTGPGPGMRVRACPHRKPARTPPHPTENKTWRRAGHPPVIQPPAPTSPARTSLTGSPTRSRARARPGEAHRRLAGAAVDARDG